MKNFNRKVFITASMVAGLLVVISLFSTLETQSGKSGSNTMTDILSGLFLVLRFPAHTLMGDAAESNALLFSGGLVFNCLFYGLVYERSAAFIKGRKAGTPT